MLTILGPCTMQPEPDPDGCPKRQAMCQYRGKISRRTPLYATSSGPSRHFLFLQYPLSAPHLYSVAEADAPSSPTNPRIHQLSLPVLIHLGVPSLFTFSLLSNRILLRPNLTLEPLPRSQNFALKIETSPLLRIIGIKQALEPVHHVLHICFPTLRWLHVQDLACFF